MATFDLTIQAKNIGDPKSLDYYAGPWRGTGSVVALEPTEAESLTYAKSQIPTVVRYNGMKFYVEYWDGVSSFVAKTYEFQNNEAVPFTTGVGYTAENSANKTVTVVGNETSTTKYLSVRGYYDYLIGLVWLTKELFGTWITGLATKTTPLDTDTIIVNDGVAKKTTWLQIKTTLKTYFDTLYLTALANNSITNALLSQMSANTVKVNNTNATANATDLSLGTNTVLGREAGNIVAIPIQETIISTAQLVAGTIQVVDSRITVNSFVSGLAISSTGTSTSEIKWTASAGVMTFSSVVGTDTTLFGYTIII